MSAPSATQEAKSTVLVVTNEIPTTPTVRGYDFNQGVDYDKLLESYARTGFQATAFGQACEVVEDMLRWRLSHEPVAADEDDEYRDPAVRERTKAKIFLGYTSNMSSCGVRETIRFLVQHRMVDVLVTTAGGIEEDIIKCLAPVYLGDFALNGRELRLKGQNRIGNLIMPNNNYVLFEEWLTPILDAMVEEQAASGEVWTPSRMIARMGKEINHEDSVLYWAWRNNIPVFSPAITDGAIGDMVFFHSFDKPGLVLDLVGDIRRLNNEALYAKKTGMIILGGGVVKHHVCNANLMRNGADFTVFINTGQEFDGSDSGARPDEAVSWGKIRIDGRYAKVYADASLVFPLLVARTFARHHFSQTQDHQTPSQ